MLAATWHCQLPSFLVSLLRFQKLYLTLVLIEFAVEDKPTYLSLDRQVLLVFLRFETEITGLAAVDIVKGNTKVWPFLLLQFFRYNLDASKLIHQYFLLVLFRRHPDTPTLLSN